MKFICLKENLKNKLNITDKIVTKNLNLPILNNILIETDKNKVKISSTNLEIGIISYLPAKIEEEGSISVPSKTITSFINNLPNDKVILSTDKKNILNIKSDDYKTNINGIDSKNFPIIPKISSNNELLIEAQKLKLALRQLINIINNQEIKVELNGLNFKIKNKILKIASTDTSRLGEVVLYLNNDINLNQSLIIPSRTCQEILRILNDNNDLIKIIFDENQVAIEFDDIKIISRLINGQFPDYENVIPKSFKFNAIIPKNELVSAIRTVSIFSSRINDIKLKTNVKKLLIELSCQNSDIGESETKINCEEAKGEDFELMYNYKFLLEGIENIEDEKVFLGISSDLEPLFLKGFKDEYKYILMPLKVL